MKHRDKRRRRTRQRTRIESFAIGKHVTFTDYTLIPHRLEELIQAGRLVGVLTLYKITGDAPGKFQLGMMNGGLTIEATFDLLCLLRRDMMERMNFIDIGDKSLMERRQEDAANPLGVHQ